MPTVTAVTDTDGAIATNTVDATAIVNGTILPTDANGISGRSGCLRESFQHTQIVQKGLLTVIIEWRGYECVRVVHIWSKMELGVGDGGGAVRVCVWGGGGARQSPLY